MFKTLQSRVLFLVFAYSLFFGHYLGSKTPRLGGAFLNPDNANPRPKKGGGKGVGGLFHFHRAFEDAFAYLLFFLTRDLKFASQADILRRDAHHHFNFSGFDDQFQIFIVICQ